MKCFHCDYCGQAVFFENFQCVRCGHALGYLPDLHVMSALESVDSGRWRSLAPMAKNRLYQQCRNYQQAQVCNWMVPAESTESFCPACRLNRTIPDLAQPGHFDCWQRLERAKHRLVYSLILLGLPLLSQQDDPERGLAFDFLADENPEFGETETVMTGHANGLITLNIAEADDLTREKMRLDMNERYRTVLGHFRHESGHYYWELLVRDSSWLTPFRDLFGDERTPYDQALHRHYQQGPPNDWAQRHISSYASAHPWEDWAETWAHYLHITDTLETAVEFGLTIDTATSASFELPKRATQLAGSFDRLLSRWWPLTFALNSLNRSMGLNDPYPFVLSEAVIEKLGFVHRVIEQAKIP
ncbi:MAG: putative zinc-binding peptidase [Candidatus Competibacteraceae bacterium]